MQPVILTPDMRSSSSPVVGYSRSSPSASPSTKPAHTRRFSHASSGGSTSHDDFEGALGLVALREGSRKRSPSSEESVEDTPPKKSAKSGRERSRTKSGGDEGIKANTRSPWVEAPASRELFWKLSTLIPPASRNQTMFFGKSCGRNEIIGLALTFHTGHLFTRKTVSSHQQVLREEKTTDPTLKALLVTGNTPAVADKLVLPSELIALMHLPVDHDLVNGELPAIEVMDGDEVVVLSWKMLKDKVAGRKEAGETSSQMAGDRKIISPRRRGKKGASSASPPLSLRARSPSSASEASSDLVTRRTLVHPPSTSQLPSRKPTAAPPPPPRQPSYSPPPPSASIKVPLSKLVHTASSICN